MINMTPQGYPLHATNGRGTTYLVVGWAEKATTGGGSRLVPVVVLEGNRGAVFPVYDEEVAYFRPLS